MAISGINGTIVDLKLGSYENPNTGVKTAGVVFRIRFASGSDLDYGITFSAMHSFVTGQAVNDPYLLRGTPVVCDINDFLEVVSAIPA